jgi:hypothetical protein
MFSHSLLCCSSCYISVSLIFAFRSLFLLCFLIVDIYCHFIVVFVTCVSFVVVLLVTVNLFRLIFPLVTACLVLFVHCFSCFIGYFILSFLLVFILFLFF